MPDEVTAGLSTVAVRVPLHPVARALIDAAAVPVAAPSANLFSRPSPTLASHVIDDLGGRIDFVVDGGPTTIGVESTVLDLTSDPPTILRPGAVTADMLREVLGRVDVSRGPGHRSATCEGGSTAVDSASASPMPSPGMLEKHYSPRAELTLFEGRRMLPFLPSSTLRVSAFQRPRCRHHRRRRRSRGTAPAHIRSATLVCASDWISMTGSTDVATRLYATLRASRFRLVHTPSSCMNSAMMASVLRCRIACDARRLAAS